MDNKIEIVERLPGTMLQFLTIEESSQWKNKKSGKKISKFYLVNTWKIF